MTEEERKLRRLYRERRTDVGEEQSKDTTTQATIYEWITLKWLLEIGRGGTSPDCDSD
jgi:hypothetical protein